MLGGRMAGSPRRLLPYLLCALVATWGICPCVFGRVLGIGEADAAETTAVPDPCGCCRSHHARDASSDAREQAPDQPEKCPCCERGGSIRDLPPQGGDVVPLEPPAVIAVPALLPACVPAFLPEVAVRHATGPPGAPAPHACPVGVVRLLI
jgi:hypothetical protein